MGSHYVPQRYLANFRIVEQKRPSIWLFDLANGNVRPAAIVKVAQEPNYYDSTVEKELARKVEPPGNAVLVKLLRRQPISEKERHDFAVYMAVQLKRVPAHRLRGRGLGDEAARAALANISERFSGAVKMGLVKQADADRAMNHLRAYLPTVKDELVEAQLRLPWAGERVIDAIERMAWRVYHSSGSSVFLTSDNPFHFERAIGLAKKESRFFLPLGSYAAIEGSWSGRLGETFHSAADEALVRRFNQLTTLNARRFIFCQHDEDWVRRFVGRRRERPGGNPSRIP